MAESGIDSLIPGLPIDHAADALIQTAPTLGAIIIIETAAICALALYIMKLVNRLEEAKAAHLEDLRLNIPAMRDLRETILAEVAHRRGRSS